MRLQSSSHFLFTVCQQGAEKALKEELGSAHPDFKFAYSRPGFLTFKNTQPTEIPFDFILHSIFARAYGVSLGGSPRNSKTIFQTAETLKSIYPLLKPHLHVWQRDFYPPGKEPLGYDPKTLSFTLEKDLRKDVPHFFEKPRSPKPQELVFDVILLDENQVWLGGHLHTTSHSPWPGGVPELILPNEAPSRAYLKLEEAILWSQAPLLRNDTALELGSAPGGASYALLLRGLHVIGIDPGKMDDQILKNPHFQHIQRPVAQVLREELPDSIQWLLLDMNVEPRVSIFAVDRLASRMKESLLGVFLTLKLNHWKITHEIPEILSHIRQMGIIKMKAAQLSRCRQEFMIYGLTRKGMARKL